MDYYDRGIVSRDKVIQDLKYYFRNWAEIDTRMDGDVAMAGFEPEVRIAKFISSFSVKNEKKSITGKSENIWTIQRINGELRLIDVKQKSTWKGATRSIETFGVRVPLSDACFFSPVAKILYIGRRVSS